MIEDEIYSNAQRVYERCQREQGGLVMAVLNGRTVSTTKEGTPQWDETLHRIYKTNIVGVYDSRAKLEDIAEDIRWAAA